MNRRTIRTLRDFLAVPERELHACLRSFRAAIERAKADVTIVAGNGVSAESIKFDEFIWESRSSAKPLLGAVYSTTLVEELSLRPSTKIQLRAASIYCLEDLAEISEHELMCMPDVGRTTIERLREMLECIGMTFKPNPNPVGALYERNQAARKVPIEERARRITDASHVAELGLSPTTLRRAIQRGHATVESLRTLSVREYAMAFGRSQAKEIINTLEMLGNPIHAKPTPLDLWRHGLLAKGELPANADDDTPVANLSPWIGSGVTTALARHGAVTIRDVVSLVLSGELTKVRGIGATSAQKIAAVLKQHGYVQADKGMKSVWG